MNSESYSLDALPVDFTKPSKSFQQRAWLAVAGLGLFLILYLTLSIWFARNAVDLFLIASEGRDGAFWSGVIGLLSAFMAVFMFKALFFVIKQDHSQRVEVTAENEPQLFEFIHEIADQSGAPRPHKVYLSPIVNASVFYELSVLNLLWPSKKNLEIGIGLVNVLTLGETKAVLAHEFGHFAQRAMLIGRWVYIGQQIAGHIIAKRDALDRFISEISSWDIRIAWIGWILSIIIWAIRALAETLFTWVIIAQRALSREMEFHADLVAVSLTGSDAIVHALHHLQAADQGFQEALETVNLALQEQKKVGNLYPLQTDAIQRMRHLLSDGDYGRPLTVPKENAQEHRVFQSGMAQVPQMWATHPPDYEREANAKQTYIQADIHPESAWDLFQDPLQIQIQMTEVLLSQVQLEQEPSLLDVDSVKHLQGKRFGQAFLDPAYKGVYLDRFLTLSHQDPNDLYDPTIVGGAITNDLASIYPDSIRDDLETWQQLRMEEGSLKGLEAKFLKAPGGVIWHRGEQIQRKQLPEAIAEVEEEQRSAADQIRKFDQTCRSTHLAMAKSLGKGWEAYHQSLVAALHYSEHTLANLEDAWGVLNNVYAVVTADGRVNNRERRRLLSSCNEIGELLNEVYRHANSVKLDDGLLGKLGISNWGELFEEFKLSRATDDNIEIWLQVIDSWYAPAIGSLSRLRIEVLNQMLEIEGKLRETYQSGQEDVPFAATPLVLPTQYPRMLPSQKRPRQNKLGWWDRLYTANGTIPTIVRLVVAGIIIGAVIWYAGDPNI